MFKRLVSGKLVPTLVAAGLTVGLSTALAAAHVQGQATANLEASAALVQEIDGVQVLHANDTGDDGCVAAHLAGESGQGQITGGGVHLVIASATDESLSAEQLSEAAATVANYREADVCAQDENQAAAQDENQAEAQNEDQDENQDEDQDQDQDEEQDKDARECYESAEAEGANWQNHGHYVSCVAREETTVEGAEDAKNRGQMVRLAAQSDVGKKKGHADEDQDDEDDDEDEEDDEDEDAKKSKNKGKGKGPKHHRK